MLGERYDGASRTSLIDGAEIEGDKAPRVSITAATNRKEMDR